MKNLKLALKVDDIDIVSTIFTNNISDVSEMQV